MPAQTLPKSRSLLPSLPMLAALSISALFAPIDAAKAQSIYVKGRGEAPACSNGKMKEILARATKDDATVGLDCSPRLNGQAKITKRLIFRGDQSNGVTLDCQGGTIDGGKGTVNAGKDMIAIFSKKQKDGSWRVPSNIQVKNCKINGSVRIWGMDQNGEGKTLRASSQQQGHTKRARDAAPRHVWFDKVTILGTGRIPLYISPGTTHFSLTNSRIAGSSTSTAIYLDAESANNLFINNRIETNTKVRELVAVDGSSNNRFISNQFSSLNHGGIYVYRNCGEGGTVRHATPSNNQFINNSFYYNKFKGFNLNIEKLGDFDLSFDVPAIWIASRNGGKSYCNADNGFPFGSSANNNDLARNNVIAQNQIYKLSPQQMIVINDQPNITYDNVTVNDRINRPAGCYIEDGQAGYFIESKTQMEAALKQPKPGCGRQLYTCSNGLVSAVPRSCRP
ncbi:right-handed parallel beta-helix repeat-containing protein [uncultured Cohaesibacter sp.]|uniref:right-handed parallel beta-helix repeat-containing protein n=1 Tax=uncultured Cohaesibacter sp. TaxID=1002546 RepID=UPI0029C91B58|nr:right-handed parallel beta-helix repeat-containing protein [uncultured Cohaesibacter sp.]